LFILTSNWIGAIIPWSLLELPAASGELSASDQSYLVALNLLEEFSKPLSLSFRLLGNILADELTLAVLYGLVPIAVPIPVFLLGLFTTDSWPRGRFHGTAPKKFFLAGMCYNPVRELRWLEHCPDGPQMTLRMPVFECGSDGLEVTSTTSMDSRMSRGR
jgi:hypothetical protein